MSVTKVALSILLRSTPKLIPDVPPPNNLSPIPNPLSSRPPRLSINFPRPLNPPNTPHLMSLRPFISVVINPPNPSLPPRNTTTTPTRPRNRQIKSRPKYSQSRTQRPRNPLLKPPHLRTNQNGRGSRTITRSSRRIKEGSMVK
jgi:hypothetical protein